MEVFLSRRGNARAYAVESFHPHKNAHILKLQGVDTIGEAEALSGSDILVSEASLEPLGEDRHFIDDLQGCVVSTLEGADLGRVADVLEAGGSVVLVVERAAGGRELLIPFCSTVCPVIDTAAKRIVIDPPDGLLDLNEI